MQSIIRDVREINAGDRRALEHLLGAPLQDDQTLIIQILTPATDVQPAGARSPGQAEVLPDWCNVYEGLSDAEIDELDRSIIRSHESRTIG